MPTIREDHFYSNLPLKYTSIIDLLADPTAFRSVPDHWHVIIIDVKNSTSAIERNLHDLVNLTATGSIIAVLNIAKAANIEIPFFFGGDGGTLLIPETLLAKAMSALQEHKENTKKSFDLDLWLGNIPVSSIKADGHRLEIARMTLGEKFVIPIVIGTGLKHAESLVKNDKSKKESYSTDSSVLDLQGMECKWDKIKPPPNTNEVVSLLVEANNEMDQALIFKKVLDKIDQIYGSLQNRRPISLPKLELDTSFIKIRKELTTKMGRSNPLQIIRNWLFVLIGQYYLRYHKKGQQYLRDLIEFSDTLVIDGRINTVISGTAEQRTALIVALDEMEKAGEIVYGHHLSSDSIMSCYVRDRQDQHIHFVDGSDGGYTRAASQLKKKLKKQV